ncbi:MAG: DNA-directed RNA polymerase subunit D [Methanobrevibacter sp.]|jgi:DNA-directed RNA polymerase subunit D|nr:DNA-directed RNA polymerase subunit D [Methanobrevibacter sp.]
MEIEVKENSENEMVFVLNNVDLAFANAIRRIGMMEVPKIAIEYINVIKNDSRMFNEVLAHRLGLVPITSDSEAIESLIPHEECDCEDYCSKCSVSFTLNKTWDDLPKDESKDKDIQRIVYSKDLHSTDSKIKPVFDTIPLVKLKEDQEIELEAIAMIGKGKYHAKWMPTTVCSYKQYPIITFDGEKELSNDVIDACPNNVLKLTKNKKPSAQHLKKNIENCTLCKSCVRASENDAIDVSYEDNKIIFKIETDGSMNPKEVLLRACDVLYDKADKISEQTEEEIKSS